MTKDMGNGPGQLPYAGDTANRDAVQEEWEQEKPEERDAWGQVEPEERDEPPARDQPDEPAAKDNDVVDR